MARSVVRYILLGVGVVVINFALPRVLPGDPLDDAAGNGMDASVALTTQQRS